METKTLPVEIKSVDEEAGTFEALVSAFGNVDHVGDRVMKGAFANTLDAWRKSGKPIPVVLSHQWDDPFALIGEADPRAVMETERGLLVQGRLDLENPTAAQTHKLMKADLLTGFSFGYTVPEGGEKRAKDGANEVTEIDLKEFGPTLVGANPDAQLQAVKSEVPEERDPPDETSPAPPAIEDAPDKPEPAKSRAQDPLRRKSEELDFEIRTGDLALPPPPQVKKAPKPEYSVKELRQRCRDRMMELLVD
jgi:HK97 family phage prohead protease